MKDWTPSNNGSVLWRLDKGGPVTEAAGTFCFIRANEDERAQPALLAGSLRLWLHSDKRWRTFSCILKLIWNNLSSFFSLLSVSKCGVKAALRRLALLLLLWKYFALVKCARPAAVTAARSQLSFALNFWRAAVWLPMSAAHICPRSDARGGRVDPGWHSQQISKSVWVFKKTRLTGGKQKKYEKKNVYWENCRDKTTGSEKSSCRFSSNPSFFPIKKNCCSEYPFFSYLQRAKRTLMESMPFYSHEAVTTRVGAGHGTEQFFKSAGWREWPFLWLKDFFFRKGERKKGWKKLCSLFVGNFTSQEFQPLLRMWPQLLSVLETPALSCCFAAGGVKGETSSFL